MNAQKYVHTLFLTDPVAVPEIFDFSIKMTKGLICVSEFGCNSANGRIAKRFNVRGKRDSPAARMRKLFRFYQFHASEFHQDLKKILSV